MKSAAFTCPTCGLSLPFVPTPPHRCRCQALDSSANVPKHHIQPAFADIVSPVSDRAVVTVACGADMRRLLEIVRPRMQDYADRIDADLVVIDVDAYPEWPIANKFRIREVCQQYARTLFLDVDLWLSAQCPDLFEKYPAGSVWMHNDTPFLRCERWFRKQMRLVADSQGFSRMDPPVCWNSGVVLMDRGHADIWKPPEKPMPTGHVMEQHLVTLNAHQRGIPIRQIETLDNLQFWMQFHFKRLRTSANVLHFANAHNSKRIDELTKLAQAYRDSRDAPDRIESAAS